MDTTPEAVHRRIAAALAAFVAVGAAVSGFLLNGSPTAAVWAVAGGSGTALGMFIVRRRVLATLEESRGTAMELGYAEGIGDMVVVGLHAYAAAVFPMTGPGGVSMAERLKRRDLAYQLTATEGLPHHVAERAAAALEAIDAGRDHERVQSALNALMRAVHEQRRRV
ncbi:hypothetical protein AB0G98_08295 [Streptomyces sp. NPDC020196]|uniref:hypothetical protein n=1 Tax=Streptomyces sp. NPDC020196 TaxID=3156656 RepID=UPI0033F08484